MKRWKGWTIVVLGLGLAAAAATDVEERGMRWVAAGDHSRSIRKEPDAAAEELSVAKPGYRVRFVKKHVVDGEQAWFLLDTPGFARGWIAADSLTDRLPNPPALKPLPIDKRDLPIYRATAALTSAGRGFDERAARYAQQKQADGNTSFGKATVQFLTTYTYINRIMRDVPHDGETPDATGKVHPSGEINEKKTADGRMTAGNELAKELLK